MDSAFKCRRRPQIRQRARRWRHHFVFVPVQIWPYKIPCIVWPCPPATRALLSCSRASVMIAFRSISAHGPILSNWSRHGHRSIHMTSSTSSIAHDPTSAEAALTCARYMNIPSPFYGGTLRIGPDLHGLCGIGDLSRASLMSHSFSSALSTVPVVETPTEAALPYKVTAQNNTIYAVC
jgi:hypothetical protein